MTFVLTDLQISRDVIKRKVREQRYITVGHSPFIRKRLVTPRFVLYYRIPQWDSGGGDFRPEDWIGSRE